MPDSAVDVITDPIEEISESSAAAIETVERTTTSAIDDLSEALKLHGNILGTQGSALGRIEQSVADLANAVNETLAKIATSATEIVSETAQIVAEAPGAAAETVEAVVEEPAKEPKKSKRRKVIGKRRR